MAVLFRSDANGTSDTAVPTSVWDYQQSGELTDARFFYRNDTPVPGRTVYFRNDFQLTMLDAYNEKIVTQINLTPGTTYYLGGFFRFDRISSSDIWRDISQPDSYDKLLEHQGNFRWLITAGWPNGGYLGSYDGKFTFDLYSSPTGCTGCGANEKKANVSPYDANNPYLCDYGRWYAVVMSLKPSSGTGANDDGLVELFINGTKTTSLAQRVNDSPTPYIDRFGISPTVAQPAYDAPAHYRKMDGIILASALSDVDGTGGTTNYFTDPESVSYFRKSDIAVFSCT